MLIWILFLLYLPQLSVALRPTRHETRRNTPDIQFWNRIAQVHIDRKLLLNPHLIGVTPPKNVIVFVGDGMGIATVTSARINKNQRAGRHYLNEPLYFESFQSAGLVKVNTGTLGMKPIVKEKCTNVSELHITDGIVEGALQKGMGVGFVTTTRITHATPAALYAKGVDRNHEFDDATLKAEVKCTHDIAKQLLSYPASEFKVMMGGGSGYLMDKSRNGSRSDGLNVDLKWQKLSDNRRVLRNMLEFDEVSAAANEKLLGIFSPSHLPYYLDELLAGAKTVPLLWEMTSKAIEQLQNEQNGYFLMIEGGMIDIAEHENMMHVAFKEVYDFEEAIRRAREMTDVNETLIIVTADHGHALTLPGYLDSDETIFESQFTQVEQRERQKQTESWVPAMFFATGPGYDSFTGHDDDIDEPHYRQPSAILTKFGFHGGEDVGIWADGPFSELFSTSLENTEVAYIIKFLLCVGSTNHTICDLKKATGATHAATTDSTGVSERDMLQSFWWNGVIVVIVVLLVISSLSLLAVIVLVMLLCVQNKSKANYAKPRHIRQLANGATYPAISKSLSERVTISPLSNR
ncbi:hypothetical protein Angca_003440 [Angiostrongylus cantonensis]|nr:hypothetical protein Angca_003440 [Angiostrongylus cantonensis]